MANWSSTTWQISTSSAASAAVSLPQPDINSVTRPMLSIGATHTSIQGSVTKDVFGMKRTWTMTWSFLDPRVLTGPYWVISQFWNPNTVASGAVSYRGVGPFWWSDPVSPNIHIVNILTMDEPSKALGSNSLTITMQEV